MAEGGEEWELCKENIQPLRRGRTISALHQALSQQDGSGYAAIQQQKQAFESELRMYSGDDPLDVWDRYIRWTQQTYPQGGKESNLSVLLERAVKRFVDETRYHNDSRYVNIWLKFAEDSTEPLNMYSYMRGQGIGIQHSLLYIAWSEEYEKHGDFKMADSIYQQGFKCGAEPAEKLQQYHKAFQVRVSRQVMMDMLGGKEDADSPEPAQPQRSSLVDLKHRGKKTATAPIVRTGAAISHCSRGLNLKLPAAPHSSQNTQILVFDENQASAQAAAEPSEARLVPWMAPPSSREKENEMMPEKWTNVTLPQKTRAGHSVMAPPSKPNFKPYVDECDQPPVVTPCKINPTVNTVLSARKPSKEETPLARLQEPRQPEGQAKEESMYCKELLFSGVTEFSFEELRAERYHKRATQEVEGKVTKVKTVKEDLRRQIEEKQKLIQERHLWPNAGLQACPPAVSSSPQPEEHPPEPTSSWRESEAAAYRPSTCRPLTAILNPLAGTPATESDGLEGIESLNDDAIVGSYRNKTLCPSPDNTCDFVRATHLASTPFSGGLGLLSSSSLADDLPDPHPVTVDYKGDMRGKSLSPIKEASLEDGHCSAATTSPTSSLGGTSCVKATDSSSKMESCPSELALSAPEQTLHNSALDVKIENPCGVSFRRQVLDKVNLDLLSNFCRKQGPMPKVMEDDTLLIGDEVILILSQIAGGENGVAHFGQTKTKGSVVIKVDFETIPWDFYIAIQLRQRLGAGYRKYFGCWRNCFLYEDGCITLSWGCYQSTLQDFMASSTFPQVAMLLKKELLEMVQQMHSCHLVHGGIRPDTMLLCCREPGDYANNTLQMLDFSCCVDLDLQPEVKSAGDLPSAQTFIRQGLLLSSSSPYQVDLMGIAETVYMMLKKQSMKVVRKESEWKLADDFAGTLNGHIWQDFFQKILNPNSQSTVSVLSDLQHLVETNFLGGTEDAYI